MNTIEQMININPQLTKSLNTITRDNHKIKTMINDIQIITPKNINEFVNEEKLQIDKATAQKKMLSEAINGFDVIRDRERIQFYWNAICNGALFILLEKIGYTKSKEK